MEMDEDDDIYVPEEPQVDSHQAQAQPPAETRAAEELEEGEEEDEGGAMDEDDDDSDIDIITERKDGTTAAPPTQAKYSDIRNIPQRSGTNDSPSKPAPAAPAKVEAQTPSSTALHVAAPSADQASAAASKSTVDINANPIYAPVGKPITQVNIDEDLPENEKPWRKPGTDISDYFNYGFDEFTWALYAAKQENVRGEFGADAFAVNNKKMMEDFNNMMMMGGMGMSGNNNAGAPAMPAADGMPPEMQQMMQQMMASGMDPSQMDMSQMSAMFSGMQNGGGAAGGAAQGGAGQNFSGGYGGNQGAYGGYMQGAGRGRRGRW
ncbi:Pre-mRNA polyadenylation factor FIP1 [Beauveria bassiana]|uniref:Fip1 domain-containing protein n=1 Tax=Beauveria bassiana (strain ARSEF 2860) TaxID=655819 RepID=J5JP53_BEAB2|nr:Fip1 domain-containing protein [Beauveria bassiana ARSEF 2860]EJP64726.1 Fip1 domain-containing protein [Beauveria bassiana ARSEF 2860]KAH8712635.1 Pre-mRNA polyadenylation factor FIP1 [Beauveria bassiana]